MKGALIILSLLFSLLFSGHLRADLYYGEDKEHFYPKVDQDFFGLELKEFWGENFTPFLKLKCLEDNQACQLTCENESSCMIPMPLCIGCVGTSIITTFYFEEMGRALNRSNRTIDLYSFTDFIQEENFIILSSKSIYNHVDSYDSPALRRRFRSMCPEENTQDPLVFFSRQQNLEIGTPLFVWCKSGVYEIDRFEDIIYDPKI